MVTFRHGLLKPINPVMKHQKNVHSVKYHVDKKFLCLFKEKNFLIGFLVKQSPQGITGNGKNEELDSPDRSIRRTEDSSVNLKCIIKPEIKSSYGDNIVQWQYSKYSNDDMAFTELPDGVVKHKNEISIQRVSKAHRGFYRCTLNKVSFTILLRVKGLYIRFFFEKYFLLVFI